MMPSWCRQVNWGNCGIPWLNCAVLCVKDDWKGQFWGLHYCLSKLHSSRSFFPSGMTSHSKIRSVELSVYRAFNTQNVSSGEQYTKLPLRRNQNQCYLSLSYPCWTFLSFDIACFIFLNSMFCHLEDNGMYRHPQTSATTWCADSGRLPHVT